MHSTDFEFHNPVKIVSGFHALETLGYELERLEVTRPLILTDFGVQKAGLVQRVMEALDDTPVIVGAVYDQIPPDSSLTVVREVASVFRDARCDGLVAVGGGSVMDTAKAVNILVSEGGDDLMKYAGADRITGRLLPLVTIPTTAGTGSEVTQVAVIADRERRVKMAFVSRLLFPDVAILDPGMTQSLPPKLTAATAMDALTHAMEAYICLQKNPLSDAHAWAAISLIAQNLVPVLKNGEDARGRLALANAACLAGAAFSNSMVGMIHALGHATGALCEIPHGMAMNIFLPHGLEYNLEKRREAISEMLLPLAGPEVYANTPPLARAEKTIEEVRKLQGVVKKETGLPTKLSEAGISQRVLESIAEAALDDGALLFNPEDLTFEDALYVLQRAY